MSITEQILFELRAARSVLIVSHVRPDGDAIGSTVALAGSLRAAGIKAVAWNEDGVPERLAFLDPDRLVTRPDSYCGQFDLVIALDTAAKQRLGERTLAAISDACPDEAPRWINIDHHATNPGYGDLNLVDPSAPATGQIIFDLIRAANLPLDAAAASALWTAISTDTGSFQYPATTAATFETAAALVRAGADPGRLSRLVYDSMPKRRFDLMRRLLASVEFHFGGRCACMTALLEDFAATGAMPEDTEDLINLIRAIDGVVVALFVEQLGDGLVRVSSRSKSPAVDVSAICSKLGGGGHPAAAGARKRGTVEAVRAELLSLVHESLERN